MCGIAGIVGERDPASLQAMLDCMAHRGPDDQGQVWRQSERWSVGLGNRRLAILDLSSAGHQPMSLGNTCLAYNGEVYNYRILRTEMEAAGERFVSDTDTEVVLRLLQREGAQALRRLNGMFSLAFWDADSEELLLARDRFGIKPLYYWQSSERLVFASEAKALFRAGVVPQMDMRQLGPYLSFGYVPGEQTMYEDVRRLPPGHLLRWRRGRVRFEEFRDTLPRLDTSFGRREAVEQLRERLRDAVTRQMIADVPVGVLLSGGLDSSAIAALAATSSTRALHAYTIAYRPSDAHAEQSPDDARFARVIADQFGMQLQELVVAPDIADLQETVAWHMDEPVGDVSAALTFIISRAAAREVTVLLSGMGSDEIFAGYRYHVYDRVARWMGGVPHGVRRVASGGLNALPRLAGMPGVHPGLVLAAHRAGRALLDNTDLGPSLRYVAFLSANRFTGPQLSAILTPEAKRIALASDVAQVYLDVLNEPDGVDFVSRMLYADVKTYMAGQTLHYTDRLSMAASMEVRVPFLDDDVVDLALALPIGHKIRGLRGKEILRQAMSGILPPEVINRRKAGFGAPIRTWLATGELTSLLDDALSDACLDDTGIFDRAAVRKLLADHVAGEADHTHRIWTVLAFALWHRAFQ